VTWWPNRPQNDLAKTSAFLKKHGMHGEFSSDRLTLGFGA